MNEKIMKKTLMSCIAILLIAVLAITLTSFLNKPMTANAADNLFKATLASDAGQLPDVEGGHRSDTDAKNYLKNNYGAPEGGVLKITSGEQLYDFINNSSNAYRYAYLANDVGIAYSDGNGAGEGYDYKTSAISSAAVFNKVLDGNGYKVNIWGGVGVYGGSNGSSYVLETDTYFTSGTTYYNYTGYLMAINRGTVMNLTVDYKSSHFAITAVRGNMRGTAVSSGFIGQDGVQTTGLFDNDGGAGAVAGIIAGMNGDGGTIDNVRLNLNSNFKVVDYQGSSGEMYKNFAFAGGFVGRAGRGSTLKNSHIDMAEGTGIYCGVQGAELKLVGWDGWGLALSGGLVGKIDQGAAEGDIMKNAVVEYCAVTGSGTVKAYISRAAGTGTSDSNQRMGFRAYSGAAIGACVNILSSSSIADGGKESTTNSHIVNKGQIKGIVSDWTGLCQNNYENYDNVTYGQLFGSVGFNVESSALLFDLIDFRRGKGVDVSNEANISLDSFRSNVLLNWVGIYPKTEGGQVVVRLNNDSGSRYDLRIHAFADNSAMDDASLLAEDLGNTDGNQHTMSSNQLGNIIWKATFGSTERISLMKSMPIYAESKLVSSGTSGNYEYSFGSMTTISFGNTNGNTTSRNYLGKSQVLNRPSVAAATGIALEEYNLNEWKILRNGVETSSDMSGTALPGTYSMNVQAEEDTYTPLAYYSDAQRIAAWPTASYKFTITEGELTYGSNTVVSDTWSTEARFELIMASDDYFDSIKYVRNGSIVMDSADKFTKTGNVASVTIKDSTGKNGMAYSFVAYAKDGDKDIVVARTKAADDKVVKIDNESPEVSEISYFVRNSEGHDTPIDESELDTWRKDRIVVRYNIIDTKSGIKFAPSSMNGQQGASIKNTRRDDGSYDVEVVLSRNDNFKITYTDNIGNTYPVELQANVDYMSAKPTLALSKIVYPSSDYGYSTQGARIRFNPTVGCSDWQLQYSWQKDSAGNDIWEDAMAQTADGLNTDSPYIINGSKEQSFLINWNMGDAVRNISASFKMRMINLQGLYEDVPFSRSGVVTDNGFVGSFIINYKVAGIYVDNSLEAVYISGGKYDGKTIAEVIANENFTDVQAFFNKVYDGTDSYTNNVKFYINVKYGEEERNNINQFVESNGVGVLYTPAYIAVPQDIDTRIEVELKYESPNVADSVNLYATFASDSAVAELYDLYFADNKNIRFDNSYTIVGDELTSINCKINADTKITVYKETIDLAHVKGLQNAYYYGETVPQTIDVNIGVKGVEVTVQLNCLAQSIQPVGDYWCDGKVISDLGGNMEIEVKGKHIEIEALPVYVDIKMDGSDNLLTSVSAGESHLFTATYEDINGKIQNATVSLTMGDETVINAPIYKKGNYSITVSIEDKNYTVKDGYFDEAGNPVDDGTYRFYFSIRQGRLPLAMTINVEQYTKNAINYNPGVPANINSGLFNINDLTFTYYQYLEGAKYDPTTLTIDGYWDRKNAMEGIPYEIGLYHVEVAYAGNDAFFPETYMGDMVITKANTEFKFDARATHAYELDGDKNPIARTFNPVDAQTSVIISNTGEVLWDFTDLDTSKITVNYINSNTGRWEPIEDNALGAGWYTQIGEYSYRIEFAGDEHYNACASNVVMTITPAVFKGIVFEFDTSNNTYDGSNFVEDLVVNVPYSEATVEYRYNNRTYSSLSEINITEAGDYQITMTVKQSGYQDHSVTAKIKVNKAEIKGITAVPVAATYDGNRHDVTFNGFDSIAGKYIYSGFDVTITSMTTSQAGNLYAIDAGNYKGSVRISVPNHEDLILETFMVIDKAEIKITDARIGLPDKLPSGMNMTEYYGAYTKEGDSEETSCYLIYKDKDGNVVKPDSNGLLADGKYTVELDVGNNYFINQKWDVVVGKINSSKLTAPAIVAVVVTVAVMVAAIITSVVVVNKRKKEDAIA